MGFKNDELVTKKLEELESYAVITIGDDRQLHVSLIIGDGGDDELDLATWAIHFVAGLKGEAVTDGDIDRLLWGPDENDV